MSVSRQKARWQPPVWLERIALMLLGPLTLLLAAEGGLRLVGYGYPTTFFIKSASGEYMTNEKFAWQFFSRDTPLRPFLYTMPARKPAGVIRICILGESAAMGTPEPALSFGRILEVQLRRCYPDKRFEVINGAMRGINSHIIRLIARECAAHEVDLFAAYIGNNEVNGFHGPEPGSPAWAQSLTLIRASQLARSSRVGQLLSSLAGGLLGPAEEPQTQDMAFFRKHCLRADDRRREITLANFQANLRDICGAATRAGGRLILSTVPVNLKDCPPLESLHRTGLAEAEQARWTAAFEQGIQLESQGRHSDAIRQYGVAAGIDDHHAELHFRLGRCFLALGDAARAREHYGLARDWDAMQFRADSRLNGVIRSVAAAWQPGQVWLADLEQDLATSNLSDHGIPGEKLFSDHVHPAFAGNYLLARGLCARVAEVMGPELASGPAAPIPTQEQCAEAIGYTLYDELSVTAAMVGLTSRPPFLDQLDHAQRQAAAEADLRKRFAAFTARDAEVCIQSYQAAIHGQFPCWPTRFNLGSLYGDLGRYPAAAEQFRCLIGQFPRTARFRIALASCLLKSGDKPAAQAELAEALRLGPADKETRRAVEQIQGRR
jgi:tetratricopeptide (TPR) repeat protein